MRIKEDDSRVKIYVKASKSKDYVKEVLMFIKGFSKKTNNASEAVIVSFLQEQIIKKRNKSENILVVFFIR